MTGRSPLKETAVNFQAPKTPQKTSIRHLDDNIGNPRSIKTPENHAIIRKLQQHDNREDRIPRRSMEDARLMVHKQRVRNDEITVYQDERVLKERTPQSPKKRPAGLVEAQSAAQAKHHIQQRNLDSRELKEWQKEWRKIMSNAKVYFDLVDQVSIDKVRAHLNNLGTTIEPFFENSITHVVTKRQAGFQYGPNDMLTKAQQIGMKIWTYDKLVRFLNNLLQSPVKLANQARQAQSRPQLNAQGDQTPALSYLLREEKLIGPTDRDPQTRREDYQYFKGPYLLVWDPSHYNRPILYKEYPKNPSKPSEEWPQLRISSIGRCPFIIDTYMQQKLEERRELAAARALMAKQAQSMDQVIASKLDEVGKEWKRKYEHIENVPQKRRALEALPIHDNSPVPIGVFTTNHDTQTSINRQNGKAYGGADRFYDIAASGINKSTSTSAVRSVAQSGEGTVNGLGAPLAQFTSKEVSNLQRKVLDRRVIEKKVTLPIKKDRMNPTPPQVFKPTNEEQEPQQANINQGNNSATDKEKKLGYCENCQEKFEKLEAHVTSKKHIKYALDHSNFFELDDFLYDLRRRPLRKR